MVNNSRRGFFRKAVVGFTTLSTFDKTMLFQWFKRTVLKLPIHDDVYFTTGFKVMEVEGNRALVWTRLCSQEFPNPVKHERREAVFRHPNDFDEDQPVEKMDGAVKGCSGVVRFRLINKKDEMDSGWITTSEENDFTAKFLFGNLREDEKYKVEIEGRSSAKGPSRFASGKFKTTPPARQETPLNLVTSTCQYFWSFDDEQRGFKTYDSMRRLKPDIYIHTGDYIYYDKPGPLAITVEKARHKWHAMDSWTSIRKLYEEVPVYMIKDDHDLLRDDVYPGMPAYGQLSYSDGLKIWYENVPLDDKPYRTIRWGKDIQIWMVEGREYRSPNNLEDSEVKSIWGSEQKKWFMEGVEASDATFKLLFTATPVVGPDRATKKDNHANAVFRTEGNWLRQYLSNQKNMYVVNGDRHWQYVSQDLKTGLWEFGSGPVSDYHAQGWDPDDVRPEHRFLRLKGGFLNIRVDRKNHRPLISFSHRDVDGKVVHEEKFGPGHKRVERQ
ncbi:MAG: alkaline phosphatase D family protein [Cyclobacteriaceae bacterium]